MASPHTSSFSAASSLEIDQLTVILDGGYGYATSFLEEAFGGLAREMRNSKIKDIIIISEEEPQLISKIQQYITDALK